MAAVKNIRTKDCVMNFKSGEFCRDRYVVWPSAVMLRTNEKFGYTCHTLIPHTSYSHTHTPHRTRWILQKTQKRHCVVCWQLPVFVGWVAKMIYDKLLYTRRHIGTHIHIETHERILMLYLIFYFSISLYKNIFCDVTFMYLPE